MNRQNYHNYGTPLDGIDYTQLSSDIQALFDAQLSERGSIHPCTRMIPNRESTYQKPSNDSYSTQKSITLKEAINFMLNPQRSEYPASYGIRNCFQECVRRLMTANDSLVPNSLLYYFADGFQAMVAQYRNSNDWDDGDSAVRLLEYYSVLGNSALLNSVAIRTGILWSLQLLVLEAYDVRSDWMESLSDVSHLVPDMSQIGIEHTPAQRVLMYLNQMPDPFDEIKAITLSYADINNWADRFQKIKKHRK